MKLLILCACFVSVFELSGTLATFYQNEGQTTGRYLILLRINPHESNDIVVERFRQYIETKTTIDIVRIVQTDRHAVIGAVIKDIKHLDDVRNREEVFLVETESIHNVHDSQCLQQATGDALWGLSRISYVEKPVDWKVVTYKYNKDDAGDVTVYVVDSGVRITHEEFEGRAWWGYTAPGLAYEGNVDTNGHGTHVAGTIAGKTYGVAKKAQIIAVKVGNINGTITSLDAIEGFLWVSRHIRGKKLQQNGNYKSLINYSAGGSLNYVQEIVLQELLEDGLLMVAAAGNSATDACENSPSRMSSIISVGSTDINDHLSWFSNYGPCIDILAPGSDIKSAGYTSDTSTRILSGTSMAAPHVAGVVARYLSHIDDLPTLSEVKAFIQSQASNNVINLTSSLETMSTYNKLLFIGCITDPEAKAQPSDPGVYSMQVGILIVSIICMVLLLLAVTAIGIVLVRKTDAVPFQRQVEERY